MLFIFGGEIFFWDMEQIQMRLYRNIRFIYIEWDRVYPPIKITID